MDNGSRDGTPAAVLAAHPTVAVIALPAGHGSRRTDGRGPRRRHAVRRLLRRRLVVGARRARARPPTCSTRTRGSGSSPRRVLVGTDERLEPACAAMAASPLAPEPGLPGPRVLGFVACGAVVRRSAYPRGRRLRPASRGRRRGGAAGDGPRRGRLAARVRRRRRRPPPPSGVRDHDAAAGDGVRNDLWFAWQRRPLGHALRHTARAAAAARRDPAGAGGRHRCAARAAAGPARAPPGRRRARARPRTARRLLTDPPRAAVSAAACVTPPDASAPECDSRVARLGRGGRDHAIRSGGPAAARRERSVKAVTWHGKRDVRVDDGPRPDDRGADRRDHPGHLDRRSAAPTCTSTRCSAPFMSEGDILGHEPMGIVEEVGAEVTQPPARRPRRHPVPDLLRALLHVRPGAADPVRDDPGPRAGHGRGAVRLHEALRRRCPAARPSTCACRRRSTARSRCPRARPTTASSTSPTCCRPRGRRSSTPTSPTAARVVVLGLGPIGDMACRIALHQGAAQVIGVDLVAERLERARARGVEVARPARARRRPRATRPRADRRPRAGRGDRRRRHGGARLAGRQARPADGRRCCPTRSPRRSMETARRRPAGRAATSRSTSCAAAARSR